MAPASQPGAQAWHCYASEEEKRPAGGDRALLQYHEEGSVRLRGLATAATLRCVGGIWNVRRLCRETDDPRLRKFLTKVNDAYWARFGSWIGRGALFGSMPVFPHGAYGIFISGGAEIGANAVIFQQVTIGSNTLPDSRGRGAPRLGSDCYIGAGAKLIGGIRVGDRVRVGANCVIATDVPDDSVVVAQPARIIRKDTLLNRHYLKDSLGRWVYLDGSRRVLETDECTLALLDGIHRPGFRGDSSV